MLSGKAIIEAVNVGDIVIDPFDPTRVGPNSYDLTLNKEIKTYTIGGPLDMKKDNPVGACHMDEEKGMLLYPGNLYLACTNEVAGTKNHYVPCIDGRSSVARLGIQVHITAGFGDVGFVGQWTLEITVAKLIRVYPNVRICQIYFYPIMGDYDSYNGKYVNSRGAMKSYMFKDREFNA